MEKVVQAQTAAALAPIRGSERIQALDVIRGFALLGIFLMNVEYFNRPLADMQRGLPAELVGVDWWAGWLIYNFVQGKFWTMFSLLFGMGFAVMLTRAERAEREFLQPYLRRIGALAVFGAVHHIFIWGGDILFSYAVGAVALLILLYGRARYVIPAITIAGIGGAVFERDALVGAAASLSMVGLAAIFLRSEKQVVVGSWQMPPLALVFFALGGLMLLASLALWFVPGLPKEPRIPLAVGTGFVLALGGLIARFQQPTELRMRRLGIGMYLLPFLLMTAFGAVQWVKGPDGANSSTAEVTATVAENKKIREDAGKLSDKVAQERAKKAAERAKRKKEHEQQVRKEEKIYSQGSYLETVELRAREFPEHAAEEAGFAVIVVGMFLIGAWFVRSGVMENTAAHLPLFRKLALYGIPLGLGLGLLGSAIATGPVPEQPGRYQVAMGLAMLGNLPACLGYVGLLVLLLHSGTVFAKIRVLAPAGRMALTNYLTQSLIGTWFFYGYGLAYWGMGRALQVVFVFAVFALQVVFSHWWLARFHYGPMEWLWRTITYAQLPVMRRREALT